MQRAKRNNKEIFAIVDGFEVPGLIIPQKGIIHGDRISISIAGASILAKVERDRLMQRLAKKFPDYGFEKHKGYGTRDHRERIILNGLSEAHRVQFCRKTLGFS
jgi:ribonuclease HII